MRSVWAANKPRASGKTRGCQVVAPTVLLVRVRVCGMLGNSESAQSSTNTLDDILHAFTHGNDCCMPSHCLDSVCVSVGLLLAVAEFCTQRHSSCRSNSARCLDRKNNSLSMLRGTCAALVGKLAVPGVPNGGNPQRR